ncbi:MAG: molybdenum cofactor guanylyltransferase [Acidimicrobiia bacterium]
MAADDVSEFDGGVLTGGKSSRMGSDKALLLVRDEPMALSVTRAIERAGAHATFCVGGDLVALAEHGLVAYPDGRQGQGPLAGILSALEITDAPILFVAACDMPNLVPAAVARLVGLVRDTGVDVAMVEGEPLCAAWQVRTCRPVVTDVFGSGKRAVRDALEHLVVVTVTDIDRGVVKNVNEPGDVP